MLTLIKCHFGFHRWQKWNNLRVCTKCKKKEIRRSYPNGVTAWENDYE